MLPKEPGIYKIWCKANDKIYVGSGVNIYRRWRSYHLPQLRKGRHCNPHLQAAWFKYGEAAFTCEVIELCVKEDLVVREQYWLDKLKCVANGFNICAVAGNTLGIPQSAKCKAAIKLALCKNYVVTDPSGCEQAIINLHGFCEEHELNHSAMSRVAVGRAWHHKQWECRYATQSRDDWVATVVAPATRPMKDQYRKRKEAA